MKNYKLLDIGLILIICLATYFITKPLGNFPINDDFSFIDTVKRWYFEGKFIPHPVTSMTLFSQAWLGYVFSLIFGFSIENLRILVAILSCTALIFTYLTAIELKINRIISLFICFLLFFNPIYLLYSYSFMTDVPFFCFSMISIYFYIKNFKEFHLTYWLIAIVFSIIAILTRQVGMAIMLAFGITYLVKNKITAKNIFIALFPFIIGISTYMLYKKWLSINNITPEMFNSQGEIHAEGYLIVLHYVKNLISNFNLLLVYLALFTSPILIIYGQTIISAFYKKIIVFSVIISTLSVVAVCLIYNDMLPVNKNVFTNKNILGPFDDDTMYSLPNNHMLTLISTIFAVLGLFLLILFSFNYLRNFISNLFNKKKISYESIFFILLIIFYQLPILLFTFYERYVFISVISVSFIISIFYKNNISNLIANFRFKISLLLLLALSINSTINVKDYMIYSKTRWDIMTDLLKNKVEIDQISGGYTYFGTYYNTHFKEYLQSERDSKYAKNLKYFIQIIPNKEFKIISEHKFETTYKIGNNTFYVCKKE